MFLGNNNQIRKKTLNYSCLISKLEEAENKPTTIMCFTAFTSTQGHPIHKFNLKVI